MIEFMIVFVVGIFILWYILVGIFWILYLIVGTVVAILVGLGRLIWRGTDFGYKH